MFRVCLREQIFSQLLVLLLKYKKCVLVPALLRTNRSQLTHSQSLIKESVTSTNSSCPPTCHTYFLLIISPHSVIVLVSLALAVGWWRCEVQHLHNVFKEVVWKQMWWINYNSTTATTASAINKTTTTTVSLTTPQRPRCH